ncbi:DoxX family protein [Chondromyces crocatus]|uniref:DoxX family protein n=1 Tax=Chondromyces crocatus TaxID=52 RepID=A0A0K1E8G9_CHOCO|nr:DoxX family protein [Chondromyces crocatus]AKT36878.1 uncharacterized protein CMC5_009990 [Chondromyces crocatus]
MTPAEQPLARWSLAKRIGFRFAFVYLVLYFFPFPAGYLPGTDWIRDLVEAPWNALVPWVGEHVLGVGSEIPNQRTGSGDRLWDYVQTFCLLALAIVGASVWSVLDARRTHYTRLAAWLRLTLRYALGVVMIDYGLAKIIPTQFVEPGLIALLTPLGELSPMGLLWNFMGHSTPYATFGGVAEVVGGLLLFFRRTTTLGALVVIGVMSNVVMMNLSYDVPVKLYSSHLLLVAVALTLPDARRLSKVLVLNQPTQAVIDEVPWRAPWMDRVAGVTKVLFLGTMLSTQVTGQIEASARQMAMVRGGEPPLGDYLVESFVREGQDVPPLVTDESRWQAAVLRGGYLSAMMTSGKPTHFQVEQDAEKKTFVLTHYLKKEPPRTVSYSMPGPDQLVLEDVTDAARFTVRLRRTELSRFPLVSRGFHWVNEVPGGQ